MKLPLRFHFTARRRLRSLGFTITEVMISMAILLLALSGVVTSHLFGMKMYDLTKSKLGASDDARETIGNVIVEVRSARIARIGTGGSTSFTECGINTPQQGNAIELYPTTNTNIFVRYYLEAAVNGTNARVYNLKRTTNNAAASTVIAHSISNTVVFTSENYAGTVLTNKQNNRVIGLTLNFLELFNPSLPIGPGNYVDYYQLRTRITPRTLE